MQNSSIKKTLPRLTRLMMVILIVLILPANIYLQLLLQHRSQQESSREVFSQLEQVIETNEETLEKTKEDFSTKCIRSAEMAAYFVEHFPEAITGLAHVQELAKKLDVDEIHFLTGDGRIYAGTHPEYYNYTFDSGKQMEFFKPMLSDHSLKLCQEIQPNTAEGKEMQYAAVWTNDGKTIVQIGMEPRRVLEEIEEKSLENVLSTFPTDFRGYLHILDKETGIIIASTSEKLLGTDISAMMEDFKTIRVGKTEHYKWNGLKYCVYSERYEEYLLVRSYLSLYPFQLSITSTVIVLLYIVVATVAVIGIIGWYVNKKLVGNLNFIVNDLKKIEEGNLENITIQTGVQEFDELIRYLNQMLKSIRLNWNKLSYVIDKGRIPLGVFEENVFYKKQFINERMLELLGIEKESQTESSQLAKTVRECLEQSQQTCLNAEENIYEYNRGDRRLQLRIEVAEDEQSITYYVTDVSQWWEELHELRKKSNCDSLTGLYNRRGFHDCMEQLFKEPDKIGAAVMIMLDADGLKQINDFYGHQSGDKYLQCIGAMLGEIDNRHGISARFGGDEFAAFLYGFHSEEEIQKKVEEFKQQRGKKLDLEKDIPDITLEFSMGYVYCHRNDVNYHELMYIADERMYKEKNERKGRA